MSRILLLVATGLILFSPAAMGATVLVLNLDRTPTDSGPNANSSTDVIRPLLTSLGYPYDYLEVSLYDHTTLATMNLNQYQLLVISVGTNCLLYQVAHRFDAAEGQHLVDYLNAGGKIYMEGNDVWYQDPHAHGTFDFKPAFNVSSSNDGGTAELAQIRGVGGSNPVTTGLVFTYSGDNCFPDWIQRLNPTGGSNILLNRIQNPFAEHYMGVSYDSGTYKTIACSFEFGGLVDGTGNSTKAYVWQLYMDWFGITAGSTSGDVDNDGNVDAGDLALLADYLADNATVLPGGTSRADVNSSGEVDVTDLTILHHYLVGNITTLPFTG